MKDKLAALLIENEVIFYVIVILITVILALILKKMIKHSIDKYFISSAKKLNVDVTKYNFIKNASSAIIYLLALFIIFYSIPSFRSFAVTMFASAGIITAIFALASQQAFSNIVGGIFIVIFHPFRVGDNVNIGIEYHGIVEDITLRHTVIKNFENRRIIIPNSVISSKTILNSTISDPKICNHINIGISYFSNIDLAMKIIKEEALNHPNILDNRSDEQKAKNSPVVKIRVIGLNESAVTIRAYTWAENTDKAWELKCDLLKSIKERFDREGIEIPFPHRTVYLRNEKH
ncbi:MAG: mechanosensitive ion channel family protein [Melioribacteraceae bacterium]|nr:mechanosensitive ion channel family protein [Melioribacteraceae bacterium]